MRKFSKKHYIAAGVAAVIVAAGAGTAFAYWTTTGSGNGSGTVAASNGTLVLHGTIDSGLTPGGSETVHFTADNPGTSSLQVGTVHTVVATTALGCDATWFSVADVAENQTIAAGATGVALTNTGSISFTDTAGTQDAFKGAPLTLTLSS
jgi:hypothetical protein